MRQHLRAIAAALCLPLLASGCATPAEPPAVHEPSVHLLLTATAGGAVLLDLKSNVYIGVDRDGRRVWTDRDAYARGASVVCAGGCPDAVVSGAYRDDPTEPAPLLYTGGTPAPFAVPHAKRRTVLTARSSGDAVVAETDGQGASWLHLVRPGGAERIPLNAPEAGWFESPDGTTALLLPRVPSGTATVRWFVRDSGGWRATGYSFNAVELRDACVVRDGRTALLAGPQPLLVLDRTGTVPVRTDLPVVSECSLGERGGVVLARSFHGPRHRTDVRGIGLDGAQTWSRGYDSQAAVATDPSGERVAIAHDGILEVFDRAGQLVRGEPDVEGVRFTAEGQLVVVGPDGGVRWLS
jgi:hypothetical protein